MPIYLVRSGAQGQYEQRFLDEGRITFNWSELSPDVPALTELSNFYQLFDVTHSNAA